VYARCWTMRLWVLLLCLAAGARAEAAGRESRWGTVLVTGGPEETPPVLYVAARTATLVDFEELVEPRAELSEALRGRVEVLPFGESGLVISPTRNLEEGERLLLPVTGRTREGRTVTRTVALATRKDVVDAEARVPGPGAGSEVAQMLQESHIAGGSHPSLGLRVRPEETRASAQESDTLASMESVLLLGHRLFATVAIRPKNPGARPWRLGRARMEPRCIEDHQTNVEALSLHVTSSMHKRSLRFHTFAAWLPVDAECVTLTLEEDGPRTLHFLVRLPR